MTATKNRTEFDVAHAENASSDQGEKREHDSGRFKDEIEAYENRKLDFKTVMAIVVCTRRRPIDLTLTRLARPLLLPTKPASFHSCCPQRSFSLLMKLLDQAQT